MSTFKQENLTHIKNIFQDKTGVELSVQRSVQHAVRTAVVLAAVFACFTITALAASLFSSLDGDDLGFNATYEGDGIVMIEVENRSDKELRFQPELKLRRYVANVEIEPISDAVKFEGTKIEPHSTGIMTIDLSQAYNMAALEEPLADDWYYFVLTNNNFMFGQDWMCSISFAKTIWTPIEYPEPATVDDATIQNIEESLHFYFEANTKDSENRRTLGAQYVETYTKLFEMLDASIVSSYSPCLPGNRIDTSAPILSVNRAEPGVVFDESIPVEEQHLLIGMNYFSTDAKGKFLATEGEYALVLSASLPDTKYGGEGHLVPLMYILTYKKSTISSDDDLAFIYGQLYSFTNLEEYKVYEDEQYICYEVSGLIYSNLMEYTESYAAEIGNTRFDDQVRTRIQNIYDYYKENLPNLFYYREFTS